MIGIILLVCILLALAATAYFPGNEGATYRPPQRESQDRHRRADRLRNPNKPDTALRNWRWTTVARGDTTPSSPPPTTTWSVKLRERNPPGAPSP